MYAICVKQPWAEAIARFGKDVENRTRRPPAHLIGQRVAIHAGKSRDEWDRLRDLPEWARQVIPHGMGTLDPLSSRISEIAQILDGGEDREVSHAGRIVATATLAGWVALDGVRATRADAQAACYDGDVSVGDTIYRGWDDDAFENAPQSLLDALDGKSPWAIASSRCQWLLADVVALPEPVGADPCRVCAARADDPEGVFQHYSNCRGAGRDPIRGQVYPFALSPEVEAEVLRQEAAGRAR